MTVNGWTVWAILAAVVALFVFPAVAEVDTSAFVGLAVIALIIAIFFLPKPLYEFFLNRVLEGTRITREEYLEYHVFLYKQMEYYRHLSTRGRAKFINRVHRFLTTKEFIGRDGMKVSNEIRTRIAGAAVQLTFGLDKYILSHYRSIRVYPKVFYSKLLDANLKGGTSIKGTMAFSWEDFEHGYADEHDGINLGLHEMAHALKFDVTYGNMQFDRHFQRHIEQWDRVALPAFNKLKEGRIDFFRKYGATNLDEFFSVAVEHFFEKPDEFKEKVPDLFNYLRNALGQDPTNYAADYELESK